MRKRMVLFLLAFLLTGCEKNPQPVPVETTVETTIVTEPASAETTLPEIIEETQPVLPDVFYPTLRTSNGRAVYDFGMALYNDTQEVLTVTAMHVVDYSGGEEVASRTYTGREMDNFNGDRPANYTMEPNYPVVLFIEEPASQVTFDIREITVVLQSQSGEETERFFRFEVNEEQDTLHTDPETADWLPALLVNQSRRFACLVTNDTDQTWTLTGGYSIQYVGSNPIRFSYRMPTDSYNAQVLKLLPGESAAWCDDIGDNNAWATHRKYVLRYEDPFGNGYEKTFHFKVDRENDTTVIPMTAYGLIPASSGEPEYTPQEIQEMVDANLSLEEVAEKISTIADLAEYLQRRGYSQDNRGDLKFQQDGVQWHTSRSAATVFAENKGNCGAGSNLANYILQGDYEEQGYIHYAGNLGGHIFNYFYQDGRYYVMDLTTLFFWSPVKAVDNLEDFAESYIAVNHETYPDSHNHYIRLLYACKRDGEPHPLIGGKPMTILAEDVKDQTRVLYQSEEAFAPIFTPAPPRENWPKEAQ